MKRVAVGRAAGGFDQAVGTRSRRECQRHKMSVTGQRMQADGGKEVLVEEQEVWEEWTGQTVEDTKWRKNVKGQWRAKEQVAMRRGWNKDMEREKVFDRG